MAATRQSGRTRKRDNIAKPARAKDNSYQQWSVRDESVTKAQQAKSLFAEHGVVPRYSGEKKAFYITINPKKNEPAKEAEPAAVEAPEVGEDTATA